MSGGGGGDKNPVLGHVKYELPTGVLEVLGKQPTCERGAQQSGPDWKVGFHCPGMLFKAI